MSLLVMAWVKKNYTPDEGYDASPLRKCLLWCLGDEANDDGLSCYPGLERLARESCCSVGGARENLDALEQQGAIVIVRPRMQGRGHFNRYGVCMDRDPVQVRHAVILDAIQKGASLAAFKDHPDNPQPDDLSVDKPPKNARKGYTEPPETRGKGAPQTAQTQYPQPDTKTGATQSEKTTAFDPDARHDGLSHVEAMRAARRGASA